MKQRWSTLSGLYGRLRDRSPKKVKCLLTRAVFALTDKPSVASMDDGSASANGSGGVLVISADFELAWGWRYSKTFEDPLKMAMQARGNIPRLLEIFDEYRIPVTWATVGHLMLRSCTRRSHAWMRRIPYFENERWLYDHGDWFEHDPCGSWERSRAWYAPDIVEAIIKSPVGHEIGCHTFSHMDMSDENCPREVAEDEIKACVDVARQWGLMLRSFVFAGGTYGNYEVLRKYGFTNYRRRLTHDLSYPRLDNNELVVLPSSVELNDDGCTWSREYYIRRLTKFLDRAAYTRSTCHFWFHPSMVPWYVYDVLPPVMRHAAGLRDKGLLWIGTMGAATRRFVEQYGKVD
ncbi:MAG: polysaccharide deacetylase family protein [candidate division WOR-3 bacterium]|nr:MAG: polysaccharide deacetylase family protein [candidate division WOR-3 bacterium]